MSPATEAVRSAAVTLPSGVRIGSPGAVRSGAERIARSDRVQADPVPTAGRTERDAAITALFTSSYPRLLGLARLVAADPSAAEDLVQDAFAALHRHWRRIRDPKAALGYLQRSVVNAARNQARGRAVRDRFLRTRAAAPAVAGPAERAEDAEERHRLVHALHGLPTRQRQVLALRYYLDLSEADIAAALSISRGSVKQHAARGLAALARAVGEAR